MTQPILAILYDFDSTLATMDMQNFSFIPSLGLTPKEFWELTGEFAKETGCDRTLSYLFTMVRETKKRGIKMTREYLNEMGKKIEYFKGVEEWFERINKYGESKGIKVEHYLISSGNKEIVEGCSIYKYFKRVYGCEFLFDAESGEPVWPKFAVNYTQKTQYFYRVSKGAFDAADDIKINEKTPIRRVPYTNIVYIGDGMTDIPAMVIAKNSGGTSIAVYSNGNKEKVLPILQEERVSHIAPADYSEDSKLDQLMHLMVDKVSLSESFRGIQESE